MIESRGHFEAVEGTRILFCSRWVLFCVGIKARWLSLFT
jgi:hypothetical protein